MKNKFAVVTGASSGIGLELARRFANDGFDLLLVAENSEIVDVATELSGMGVHASGLQSDLATYEGVESVVQMIRESHRNLDAVAINAGVGVGGSSFDKSDLQAELNMIQLNVVHPVHLTKRVLPTLLQQGFGGILYTSSVASIMPAAYESVYAGTKAFLQFFLNGVREEIRGKGIQITSMLPGPTETNFFHRAGMDDTRVGQAKKDDPAMVAKLGYDAFMSGKDEVISASVKNKIQAEMAKMMPASVATKMHGHMAEPNSPGKR